MKQFLQRYFLGRKLSVFLVGLIFLLLPELGWGQSAVVTSRPSHIDLSTATSEGAVLITVSGYSTNDARYRIFNGSNQYNCWDGSSYVTSNTYSAGPIIPGSPTSGSNFWILYQRGTNTVATGTYRDRLGPNYSSNHKDAAMPAAQTIATGTSNRYSLTGSVSACTTPSISLNQKYVIAVYDATVGGTLISAASTALTSGAFSVVCPSSVTIKRVEILTQANTLLNSITGTWNSTISNVGSNISLCPAPAGPTISAPTLSGTAPYCAGSSVNVTFTSNGVFNGSNTFTAQLSDASGSFATPIATSSGTTPISLTIPLNAVASSSYKVRVIATDPATTGSESAAFSVNAIPATNKPSLNSGGAQTITTNSSGTVITASTVGGSGFAWHYATAPNGAYTPINGAANASYTPNGSHFPGTGTYYLVAIATSTCGAVSGTSDEVTVTVNQETSLNSKVVAVSSSEATSISSIINTNSIVSNTDGTEVWQFTLTDGDGASDDTDNLPTIYRSFEINAGTGNTVASWSAAIEDARFFDVASGNLIAGQVDVVGNSIAFVPGTPISITDGTNGFKTIGLRLTLKASLPTNSDDKVFAFKLTNANTIVENAVLCSQLAAFTIESDNTKNKIDVTATKFRFVQQPSNVSTNAVMSVVIVEANDANNNRDLGFNTAIEISASVPALSGSPVTATAANGLATFSSLTFTTAGTGVTLSATRAVTNDWTATSNSFDVTDAAPVMTFKQGGNTLLNGGTFNFSTAVMVGNNGTATSFTIGNTGNAVLSNIAALATGDFEITTSPATSILVGNTTTVSVRFKPTAVGPRTGTLSITSNDATQSPYVINLTGNATPNNGSDIIATTNFVYPANIDYSLYQATSVSSLGDGVAVYGFTVRDGGSTMDADDVPTILSSLTFSSLTGAANIQSAALFKGNTLVSATQTIGTTILFAGLPTSGPNAIIAADGGSVDVTLVVSFKSTVTDNQQLRFTITNGNSSVAGNSASSLFRTFTNISSPTNGGENKIIVSATALVFGTQPADGELDSNMAAFTVNAVDALGNKDLDANCSLTLSSSGIGFSASPSYSLTNGTATIANAKFSSFQSGITITATAQGCAGNAAVTSLPFKIVAIAYANGDFRSKTDGTFTTATWERMVNGLWENSGVPSGGSNIYINSKISSSGSISPNSLVVLSGGEFTYSSSGTVASKIAVKTGGILTITANITVTNGAIFEVQDGATLILNWTSLTNTSGLWGGVENFNSASTVKIQSWSSGNRLYDGNIAFNGDGYVFGNLMVEATANITLVNSIHINLKLVQNNLTINSAAVVTGNNSNSNIEVNNLFLNAGSFTVYASNATPTFTVKGTAEFNAGTVNLNSSSSGSAAVTLNFLGNVKTASGVNFGSGDAGSMVTFSGTGIQQLDIATTLASPNIVYNVKSGAQVQLINRNLNFNHTASIFNVESGATFDCNGNNVTGSGTFTLSNGATLKITDVNGIEQTGSIGNIQITSRNFENANYIYSGNTAQKTGLGLPVLISDLIIYNSKGVTLDQGTEVTNLTLNQGKLQTSTGSLLTITPTGNVIASELTSYVDGPLAYRVAGPKLLNFPIGKGANARPMELDIVAQGSGENIYTAEQFENRYAHQPGDLPNTVSHVSKVRYFSIEKTGNATVSANLKLSYGTDDGVTDPTTLSIVKFSNNLAQELAITQRGNGSITSDNFSEFSDFMLANLNSGNNPLPVELLSFTAKPKENAIVLTWETASEKNSSHFEVERSHNGRQFESIANVSAAGNSQTLKRYALEDKNSLNAIVYYRLKQVDLDGTVEFSKIVQVNPSKAKGTLVVYPNPAQDKLTVVFSGKTVSDQIQIVNLLGQVMKNINVKNSRSVLEVNISDLPAGSYYLRVTNSEVIKFMKVN